MNLNLGDTRLIIEACRKHGLLRNQAAYVLGTSYHETAHTMEPVRETLAQTDNSAIARLDRAWQRGLLPWVKSAYWRDGFFGRGYVQLTHRFNYERAGRELGVDMVSDPSVALDAQISAEVTVRGMLEGWFTGKKLSDYITLQASDYVGARRIVNGTDRARAIAEHAREYEAALLAEGYGVEKPVPVVNERRDGTPPRGNPARSTTNQAAGIAALSMVGSVVEPVKALIGDVTETFGVSPQVALVVIGLAAVGWVFRERLRKWAEGDR